MVKCIQVLALTTFLSIFGVPLLSIAEEISSEFITSEKVDFTYPVDESPDGETIERWCKADSEDVRFTTVGIVPSGYERCGSLKTQAYCDPLGNKIFTPDSNVPHGYKTCGGPPRIYLERDGKVVDVKATMNGTIEFSPESDFSAAKNSTSKLDNYFSELDGLIDGEPKQESRKASKQHQELDQAMQRLSGVLGAFGITQQDLGGKKGVGGKAHSDILQDIDIGEMQKNLHKYIEAYSLPEDFFED